MELSPLQALRLKAISREIHAILAEASRPTAGSDAATLIQAWLHDHLAPAPGHKVRADHVRGLCLADLGITMTPQAFGMCTELPKQRSNGHTYYTGVKMI